MTSLTLIGLVTDHQNEATAVSRTGNNVTNRKQNSRLRARISRNNCNVLYKRKI